MKLAKILIMKSLDFWTLYFVSWSAIALGLMMLILPVTEIVDGNGFNPRLLLIYVLALIIFGTTRLWLRKIISVDKYDPGFSSGNLFYVLDSLAVSGILLGLFFPEYFPVVNKIIGYGSYNFSEQLSKFFLFSVAGVLVLVAAAGFVSSKINLRTDVMIIFPALIIGGITLSFIKPLFNIEEMLDLQVIGNFLIGSLPLWILRLLILGKESGVDRK